MYFSHLKSLRFHSSNFKGLMYGSIYTPLTLSIKYFTYLLVNTLPPQISSYPLWAFTHRGQKKMNGYSKLRLVNKSRSIDFSDLSISKPLPHQTQKIHENITQSTSETDYQDTNAVNHHDLNQYSSKQQQHQQDEDEDDQAACTMNSSVGAKHLSKNYSVFSATSSHGFKLERQGSTIITRRGIQSAVKRAFSMRRSSASSISHEKYCRIHDQCVAILLDDDDVDEDISEAAEDNIESTKTVRSVDKKKCGSKGRILKACKRILGF